MKILKAVAVAALALSAAACATPRYGGSDITQQVYGNASPAVSSDWKRVVTPGRIAYVCPVGQCADPAAICYSAKLGALNTEMLVRKNVISANLLLEVGKSLSHATNGKFQVGSVRNLTGKNAAGFETTGSVETAQGTYYGATRVTVTGRESRSVTGVGTSAAKARRNLQIGLQGAR